MNDAERAEYAAIGYAMRVAGLERVMATVRSFRKPDRAMVKTTGYDEDGVLIGLELDVNIASGEIAEIGPE